MSMSDYVKEKVGYEIIKERLYRWGIWREETYSFSFKLLESLSLVFFFLLLVFFTTTLKISELFKYHIFYIVVVLIKKIPEIRS